MTRKTIAELRAELAQREEEHAAELSEATDKHMENLRSVMTKELIDTLRPKHDRTSCADKNISNGFWSNEDDNPRCTRCALLDMLDGRSAPGGLFFEITWRREK